MIDIKQLLSKLKAGMQISPEFEFLRKYDNVIKNSIFEQEEIDNLKDDLIRFNKTDGHDDYFTEADVVAFYSNATGTDEKLSKYSLGIRTVRGWFNSLTGENDNIIKTLKNCKVYQTLSPIQKEFAELLVQNQMRFNSMFSGYVEEYITENLLKTPYTDEEVKQILPKLKEFNKISTLSMEGFRKEDFLKLKDIDTKRVEYLMKNNLIHFKSNSDFQSVILCDNESFEKIKPFIEIPKIGQLLSYATACEFMKTPNGKERLLELSQYGDDINILVKLVQLPEDKYEFAKELLENNLKDSETSQSLTLQEICMLSENPIEKQKIALKLLNVEGRNPDNALSIYHTAQIADYASEDLFNFINENPNFQITLPNRITSSSPEILYLKETNESNSLYKFDNEGLYEIYSTKYNEETADYSVDVINYRNKVQMETVYDINPDTYIYGIESKVDHIKCENLTYNGENPYVKDIQTSKGVATGLPEQYTTLEFGTVIPSLITTVNHDGEINYVEKHFVSPEGVKTDYDYKLSDDGVVESHYTIMDKDGSVLMERTNSFQQVSDNNFISSVNNDTYNVIFHDNCILVKNTKTGKEHTINLEDKNIDVKDKTQILSMLKNIYGNQLIMMNHISINGLALGEDSSWLLDYRMLVVTKPQNNNKEVVRNSESVFFHEYGHFLDTELDINETGVISNNKELKEIYQEECREFIKNSTTEQQTYMEHLLDNMSEFVAEANVLLYASTPAHNMRAMYFQMFFPRTIAKIAELLKEREDNYIMSKN